MFRRETHSSPLWNEILCIEFIFSGGIHASLSLRNLNFFLNLCLELRHMPHLYETNSKFWIFFLGETHASPSLKNLNFSLSLCLEVRHMPHPYETKFYVLNFFFGWGTCLTLFEKSEFLLKVVLRSEAHASPLWNKVLCFEFVFFGWGTCLTLLEKSEFLLKLVVRGETHASPLVRKSIFVVIT